MQNNQGMTIFERWRRWNVGKSPETEVIVRDLLVLLQHLFHY